MKIIMLFTRYGSEDGFVVHRFLRDHQYEVADSLGVYFVRLGVAYNPVDGTAVAQDIFQL